jgi:cytochrome c-type biogenesis protein CcmH/NrfF
MRRSAFRVILCALALGAPLSVGADPAMAAPLRISALATVTGQEAEGVSSGGTGPSSYHPEAVKAIGELYSPYCPGFMLGICTAAQSAILRDSINDYANAGWSSEELVEWMVGNHGEEFRAVPLRSGWGIWAWVFPPAAILLGLTLVFLYLRHRVPRGAVPVQVQSGRGAAAVVSGEEEARLRSAIREIELDEDPSF